jgi:uncharacterized protein with HEPN domain
LTDTRSRDRAHAARMLEAIEEAKVDAVEGFEAIAKQGKSQKALRLDLIFLCESADRLSPAFHKANRGIDWDRLHGLRSRSLVHEYESFDPEDAWKFVTDEMPSAERTLRNAKFPKG